MMIKSINGKKPEIHNTVFIAEGAAIIGEVTIGRGSSVWFNSVARGDVNYITIGQKTNIQDNSVLHVTTDTHPLVIGDEVTVGHRVILHGCTVKDRVLVGMGAIVLDGAVLEEDSFIAAGTVVPPGFTVPAGKMAMGTPARVKRNLTEAEIRGIRESAENYVRNAENYIKNGF